MPPVALFTSSFSFRNSSQTWGGGRGRTQEHTVIGMSRKGWEEGHSGKVLVNPQAGGHVLLLVLLLLPHACPWEVSYHCPCVFPGLPTSQGCWESRMQSYSWKSSPAPLSDKKITVPRACVSLCVCPGQQRENESKTQTLMWLGVGPVS